MPPRSSSSKKKRKRSPPPVVLTQEQEEQLKNAFQVHDKEKTGSISVKQARRAIQSLDLTVDKQVVQSLAKRDKDGMLDFETFSNLVGPKLVQRAKALRAFELFDRDGKGVICVEDLQRVARELDEQMTEMQLEEMLNDADTEGQGFLSKEDFLSLAESLNL